MTLRQHAARLAALVSKPAPPTEAPASPPTAPPTEAPSSPPTTPPASPPTTPPAAGPTDRVDRSRDPAWLADRMWSGFTTYAVQALESLARERATTPQIRARAFLELARWHTVRGDNARALESAVLARVAHPKVARQGLQPALEADQLSLAGRHQEARQLLTEVEAGSFKEVDRLLRLANTYGPGPGAAMGDDHRRLGILNQIFLGAGFLPLSLADPSVPLGLGNLSAVPAGRSHVGGGGGDRSPKVSVLMPAYDAATEISRALDALAAQTWSNLEILVVDDASRDATVEVVEAAMRRDDRIRLVRQPSNQGTHAARNAGLRASTGDLVTVHDTDDWSHPQKIEMLVRTLEDDGRLVAALVHHVRVFDDLVVTAPTLRPSARLVAANRSSLMFRREVFDEIGHWDSVRASGDSELLHRMQTFYGEDRVAWAHPEVPLSFSLTSSTSLTGASRTGFPSMWQALGARRQYQAGYLAWHAADSFRDELPYLPDARTVAVRVPALLRLDRSTADQHVDVVYLSDFALPGGTTGSNVQEIRASVQAGMTVGLVQHRPLAWNQGAQVNNQLEGVVDGSQVRFLSAGEKVSCDVLVARFPRAVEHLMDEMPDIDPSHVALIVNQLPRRLYGVADSPPTYDIDTCRQSLESRFSCEITWHPISSVVRQTLVAEHAQEVSAIRLADDDWVNIVESQELRRPARRPADGTVRIGRHTRDATEKWPQDPAVLTEAYPATGYEVHVLGGAAVPTAILGGLPASWVVHPFGGLPVRDFLHGLDVYVYFTQDGQVEAFGRALLEALAVGVPVITSPAFRPVFGDGVICLEPHEVRACVDALMSDPSAYEQQVQRGFDVVREQFSHDTHVRRLRALGVR